MTGKAEQETITRWDEEERVADLYTAYLPQARQWERLGYPVEVSDLDRHGNPRGWKARVPKEAIRFRKVQAGQVVKRRGHGKGKPFGHKKHDELVALEQ